MRVSCVFSRPKHTLERMRRHGSSRESWNTSAIARSALMSGLSRTVPVEGVARPIRTRNRVDLPTPEGPTIATNSPGAILRSRPRSTSVRTPPCSKAMPKPSTAITLSKLRLPKSGFPCKQPRLEEHEGGIDEAVQRCHGQHVDDHDIRREQA